MNRHLLSALSVLAVTACSGGGPAAFTPMAEDLPSPAGPGSGEPFVSTDEGGVLLSWLERRGGGHDLRFARYDGVGWSDPSTIEHRSDFFVNWADFPSVRPGPDGTLWAHWLQRGPAGGYDYGVRIVRSHDDGATWTEAWTPHEDDSPTEHGFVSAFVQDDRIGFVWLDGRKNDPAAAAGPEDHAGEMTLRFRDVDPAGEPGVEQLLDGRVCDCCQTAATLTDEGPVVVYRNRSEAEVRDIYVTRRVDGTWTEGAPVHDDGWVIGGCPVNGPAIASRGTEVAVAWFTAPEAVARVKVAFSDDAGRSFGSPVVVDDGNPGGRVDVHMLGSGDALVTWVERTGGDGAEVRMRVVARDGGAGASQALTATTSTRPSGFPRMAPLGDGTYVLAWTDVTGDAPQVRLRRVRLAQ